MNYKHGKAGTPVYNLWMSMRARCLNPNSAAYANYGGRGITLCDAWRRFENFYADMGDPPNGATLERIDNGHGYSPDNCRWADRVTQGRNKRNNVLLTIDGETHPLAVWAERAGLKYGTVHQRLRKGWSPEDAVKTPLVTKRKGVPRGKRIYQFQDDAEAA